MQRELTLVRHAKSSWNDSGQSDFDRPLNNRGLKNAPEMGKRLSDNAYRVVNIISSPANRAISTAKIIAEEINFDIQNIVLNEHIYEASLGTLFKLIEQLDDQVNSVMLVGHNPGFTALCNYLSNARIDNMPTCSIAQIKFELDSWKLVSEHSGELIDFDYPKKP